MLRLAHSNNFTTKSWGIHNNDRGSTESTPICNVVYASVCTPGVLATVTYVIQMAVGILYL